MNLDTGADRFIDATLVPETLHPIIPLVQRWGFCSLDDQDAFIEQMRHHRPAEVQEFNSAMDRAQGVILDWGRSLPLDKHKDEMEDQDWSHPYWVFLSALKAREATGPATIEDPGVAEAKARLAKERHTELYAEATRAADDAFRLREYSRYLEILEPFTDLLTPIQQKKIQLARSRADLT